MDSLIAWLKANLPPQGDTSIAHGDYRLENLMFHPSEDRVVAVLDWELAHLGDREVFGLIPGDRVRCKNIGGERARHVAHRDLVFSERELRHAAER